MKTLNEENVFMFMFKSTVKFQVDISLFTSSASGHVVQSVLRFRCGHCPLVGQM